MVNCEVKFDNNSKGIYYSGSTLSGVIELLNDKARKIRGLSLRIEGFAKCKWTESEGTGKHRRTIHYSGREDYMNTFSYLVGTYDVTQTELSPGLHKFNFSCVLPPQLPTSFESKYGYIRYQVKVEVERPWKFDVKFCFAFTVIKVLDLNYENPALRSPLKQEITKTFFFGLSSKPLFISAEIPMSGFVAGQRVPVTIQIRNDSGVDVEETKIALKKYIHYNSQTPRRKTRERVESATEIKLSGVPKKSKGYIEGILIIPPVAPTNIMFCRVIQVSYEIHVVGKVGGIHRNPVVRLPVTIGTVPFYGIQHAPQANTVNWNAYQLPSSSSNAQPTAPIPTTPSSSGPPAQSIQDLPPPSYHQAMGMSANEADNDDEGLHDEKPFSPMYPVFNFGAQQAQPALQPQPSDPPPAYGFSSSTPNYEYPGKRAL